MRSHRRTIEAGGMAEGKMAENEDFRSCEQRSSNSCAYDSPRNTCVPLDVTEVRIITSPGLRELVDLENRQDRAVLAPQNSNRVGILKDAEGGHLNSEELIQRQITNHFTIAPSSYPPKLALKFKFPPYVSQSETCLAPGTGIYYTSRRSITSKGYGKVSTVEALSLLADVSCNMKRTHQRSSNAKSLKHSENDAYKERFNQRPREMNMASAEKNGNHPYCKVSYTDNRSKKMPLLPALPAKENSYKVVRKLRTPRKTSLAMFHCTTKIEKNISLSTCDEYISRLGASSSLTDTNCVRERLAISGTSAISSAITKVNLVGEGKVSDDKSTNNIIQVRAVPKTTTLERVSKALHQLCRTKNNPSRGFKRVDRFTHHILRFIGEMTVPEKLIRQALGNNPDTSKALRLLLTERKVMRLGSGGRGRAYEYVATEKGLHQLRELEQAANKLEVVELTPESASASSRGSLAGAMIVSDASKSGSPIQDTKSPNAPAASTNECRPSSVTPPATPTVTPHRSFKWPVQKVICSTSSQSFDLQNSGITKC